MRDKMTQVHVGMRVYVCACVCVDMWGGVGMCMHVYCVYECGGVVGGKGKWCNSCQNLR